MQPEQFALPKTEERCAAYEGAEVGVDLVCDLVHFGQCEEACLLWGGFGDLQRLECVVGEQELVCCLTDDPLGALDFFDAQGHVKGKELPAGLNGDAVERHAAEERNEMVFDSPGVERLG